MSYGSAIAFSKPGDELLVAVGKALKWLDVPSLEVKRSEKTRIGYIESIAVSPNGKLSAWVGSGGVEWRDVATGKRTDAAIITSKRANVVAFSPGGRALVIAGDSTGVDVWNLAKQELRWSQPPQADVHAVAFSPDSRLLAVGNDGKTVGLYDSQSGKPRFANIGETGEVDQVRFCSDNRTLVSLGHQLRVWDIETGKEVFAIPAREGVETAQISPDGR